MPVDYRHQCHESRTISHTWLTNRDEFFFNTWLLMKIKFGFTKIIISKKGTLCWLCVLNVSTTLFPRKKGEEKKAWYSGYHNIKNVTFYIALEVFKGRWNILGDYFRQCLEVFGSCWDVFRNPNHDRTKISCIWLRKNWQLWIRTSNGIVILYLPVHKIILSLVRYFIVCAVFVRHSSERKGGSAKTTSNEHSVIESGKSRGLL